MKKLLLVFALISLVEAVRCFYVYETVKGEMEQGHRNRLLDSYYDLQHKNFIKEKKFITTKGLLETINVEDKYVLIFDKEDVEPDILKKLPSEFIPYLSDESYKVLLECKNEKTEESVYIVMNSEGFTKTYKAHKK